MKLPALSSHHPHKARTLTAIQAQLEARKRGGPRTFDGNIRKLAAGDIAFKTCQYIEGEPDKKLLRRYGSDQFKCGLVVECGAYCTHHYSVTHIQTPLLTDSED